VGEFVVLLSSVRFSFAYLTRFNTLTSIFETRVIPGQDNTGSMFDQSYLGTLIILPSRDILVTYLNGLSTIVPWR